MTGIHTESSRLQEQRRTARVRRGGSEGSPTLLAVFPGHTLTFYAPQYPSGLHFLVSAGAVQWVRPHRDKTALG